MGAVAGTAPRSPDHGRRHWAGHCLVLAGFHVFAVGVRRLRRRDRDFPFPGCVPLADSGSGARLVGYAADPFTFDGCADVLLPGKRLARVRRGGCARGGQGRITPAACSGSWFSAGSQAWSETWTPSGTRTRRGSGSAAGASGFRPKNSASRAHVCAKDKTGGEKEGVDTASCCWRGQSKCSSRTAFGAETGEPVRGLVQGSEASQTRDRGTARREPSGASYDRGERGPADSLSTEAAV
jgi:hypothetical protein